MKKKNLIKISIFLKTGLITHKVYLPGDIIMIMNNKMIHVFSLSLIMSTSMFCGNKKPGRIATEEINEWSVSQREKIARKEYLNTMLLKKSKYCNNLNEIQDIIKDGADINTQDDEGVTPLMLQAITHNLKLVHFLISKQAKLNLQNLNNETALILAIWNNHLDMAHLLIEGGANVNLQDYEGCNALIKSVYTKQHDVVIKLVKKGAYLDLQDNNGLTALMWAILKQDFEIAAFLIDNGANLNLQTNEGCTALMYAIVCEQPKDARAQLRMVAKLIANGADIDIQDNLGGQSALTWAIPKKNLIIIAILIANGANIDIRDKFNHMPLRHAQHYALPEIITLLQDLHRFPYNSKKAVAIFDGFKKNDNMFFNLTFSVAALRILYGNKKNYRHIMHTIALCDEHLITSNLLKKSLQEHRFVKLHKKVMNEINLPYDQDSLKTQKNLLIFNKNSDLCDIAINYHPDSGNRLFI